MDIKELIKSYPDFPKDGVMFHDISGILRNPGALKEAVKAIAGRFRGREIDAIVGIEARGFIIGAALAYEMGIGFVPIRKAGKLPGRVESADYGKEYGKSSIEIKGDALKRGEKVLIVDDLLATGGTIKAAIGLVERLGAEISGIAFIIGMSSLKGMDGLGKYDTFFLIDDRDLKGC